MHIKSFALQDFRTFREVLVSDLPKVVLLASRNGSGKSSLLEALFGAKQCIRQYANNGHMDVWPFPGRSPVRHGAAKAIVKMTIAPSPNETQVLRTFNPPVLEETSKVAISIFPNGRTQDHTANALAHRLFEFHAPDVGIGYFDFIPATRELPVQSVGAFASGEGEDTYRGIFSEMGVARRKFAELKQHLFSLTLDDFLEFRRTGRDPKTLSPLRQAIDRLIAPKRLGEFKRRSRSEVDVFVETPSGEVAIEALSDGEKDVIALLAHLFRFRQLANVILWDMPELHLNAGMEGQLLNALELVGPRNQYILATHGIELIASADPASLFVLEAEGGEVVIKRPDENASSRIAALNALGAPTAIQLVSPKIVFVEGKSHTDAKALDRMIGHVVPDTKFVAANDCHTVLDIGSKANALLASSLVNSGVLAVVDRDYLEPVAAAEVNARFANKVFVWPVHEFENTFLDANWIHATLNLAGTGPAELTTISQIESALHASASSLREWIAADWVCWEVTAELKRPGRHISQTDPLGSLLGVADAVTALGNIGSGMKERYEAKLNIVDNLLATSDWKAALPGKEVFRTFVGHHGLGSAEKFMSLMAGVYSAKGISVSAVSGLIQAINNVMPGPSLPPAK